MNAVIFPSMFGVKNNGKRTTNEQEKIVIKQTEYILISCVPDTIFYSLISFLF